MDKASRDVGVELSDMIAQLRLELGAAMGAGRDARLRFVAESLELELKVSVTREGKGNAGIKFWVVEAGVEGSAKRTREQTIRLKLSPRDVAGPDGAAEGKDGKPGRPALISRSERRRRG
ncbi:MAG TPA: trypco2 family protein [Polyangiaceae bacterium]|jgi:hypothetical protein